jgi:DNA modification methylase
MLVESVPISSLIPDPSNERGHGEKNINAIKGSLAKFGQVEPLVLNGRTGLLVGGHGRLTAMKALGMTEASVVKVDLDNTQAAALRIALNRTSEIAEWDLDALRTTLEGLKLDDFDLNAIGFDDADLSIFLPEPEVPGLTDEDEVPENVETRCKLGDLWTLGNHKILCGDSTNIQHVERLMNGEKADICFTSPPYGQQRDYGVGKVSDWDELLNGVFSILPVTSAAQILVNLGLVHKDNEWHAYWGKWIEFMQSMGWRRFGWYVWDQGPGLPGDWSGRLAPAFEFIFHFNKKASKANKTKDCKHAGAQNHGTGLRGKNGVVSGYTAINDTVQATKIPDSVIRVMRHKARGIECEHPAVFPVDLATELLEAFSKTAEAAYEPFLGSGSTLIACEKTNRKCFGLEIDPKYVSVAIERWMKFTGKEAFRMEEDGSKKPYSEC